MTRITETILINTRNFISNRHGGAAWQRVVERLDPQLQARYRGALSPKGWVDFPLVESLLAGVRDELVEQHQLVLFDLGLHNAEANLKLTQRIIMRVASVNFVLKMAALLWKGRVKDGGELAVHKQGRGAVRATLSRFPRPGPDWLEYLRGWFTRTIELAGGRNLTRGDVPYPRYSVGSDSAASSRSFTFRR